MPAIGQGRASRETLTVGHRIPRVRRVAVPPVPVIGPCRIADHVEAADVIGGSSNVLMGGEDAGINHRHHDLSGPCAHIPGTREVNPSWGLARAGAVVEEMPLVAVPGVIGSRVDDFEDIVGLGIEDAVPSVDLLNEGHRLVPNLSGAHRASQRGRDPIDQFAP